MLFIVLHKFIVFLVNRCVGNSSRHSILWINSVHRLEEDTIVILYKGNFPHLLCEICKIFFWGRF